MLFCLIWESLAGVSTGFVFNRGKPQTSTKRESKDGEGGGWGGWGFNPSVSALEVPKNHLALNT